MPEFKVTAPDGTSYTVAGPPGSTREQALQKAIEQYSRTRGDYQVNEAARSLEMAQGVGKANPDVYGGIVAAGEPQIDPYASLRGPAVPAGKANFVASFKAGVIADEGAQRREIAKTLFPNDPKGAERVSFFEGSPVYVDDQGQLKRVSPSLVSGLAEIAANVPEAVGATVGSFATGNPVTGAAVGGAGGRALKRGVSELVFDEPATPLSVAKEMAGEGAVNLVAGGLGKGVAAFAGRGKVVDFSPANVRTAEQARQYVKQTTGIDLDLAQASGDRKLLALRDYAARYPGRTAELIQAADEAASGQLDNATNRVLDMISRSAPSEIAGKEGINAAQLVIRAAREKVSKEVKPLYDAAYAAVPEVTDPEIIKMLELPHFKGAMRSARRLAVLEGASGTRVASKVAPEQQIASASSQSDLDAVAKALKLFDENPTPTMQALEAAYMGRAKDLRTGGTMTQTRSPEFTGWFGKSKVVDEAGEPLRVYHGTSKDFTEFGRKGSATSDITSSGRMGYFFTDAADYAADYAKNAASGRGGERTVPAFVSIKNPFHIKDVDLETRLGQDPDLADEMLNELKAKGFDGMFISVPSRSATEYVAFYPQQVKSAIGNSGRFDAASASLTDPVSAVTTLTDAPSLRDLDYLKRGLDDAIESLRSKGKRQEAAALTRRKNEMVGKLDELSNDQWKQARQRYQEMIRSTVEPLENGIVGVLANIKNPVASRAAVKIFSDPNVTPQAINLAKTALEAHSPEAYAGLVRQYLGHRWNQALKSTQGGDVINPAGKFRQAVFGTPADRERMRAMLPAGASSAFDDLMGAMEKLSRTPLGASRVAGSNTFRDIELNESLKGQGAIVFRWLTSPRKSIQDAAEESAKQQSLAAITEALLDPAKRSQLRQVARMQPSTKQTILLTGLLSGQAAADIAPEEMPALQ